MKSLQDLISSIDTIVTNNDNMAITGELLNQLLKEIATSTYKSIISFPRLPTLTEAHNGLLVMNKQGKAALAQATGGQEGMKGKWNITIDKIPLPHVQQVYKVAIGANPWVTPELTVGNFRFFFDAMHTNNESYPAIERWRYVHRAPTIKQTVANLLEVAAMLKKEFPNEMDNFLPYSENTILIEVENFYVGYSPPATYVNGSNVELSLHMKAAANFLYSPSYYTTLLQGQSGLGVGQSYYGVSGGEVLLWRLNIVGQEMVKHRIPYGTLKNGIKYPDNLRHAALNLKFLIEEQAGDYLTVSVDGANVTIEEKQPSYGDSFLKINGDDGSGQYKDDGSGQYKDDGSGQYKDDGSGQDKDPYPSPYPYSYQYPYPYGDESIDLRLFLQNVKAPQKRIDAYIQYPILGVLAGIDNGDALVDASEIIRVKVSETSEFDAVFPAEFKKRLFIPVNNGLIGKYVPPDPKMHLQEQAAMTRNLNLSVIWFEMLEEGRQGEKLLVRRLSPALNHDKFSIGDGATTPGSY